MITIQENSGVGKEEGWGGVGVGIGGDILTRLPTHISFRLHRTLKQEGLETVQL